jgi:hypothetical protein
MPGTINLDIPKPIYFAMICKKEQWSFLVSIVIKKVQWVFYELLQ